MEERDFFRGVHDLYEFNDTKAVLNLKQRFDDNNGRPTSINLEKVREKLVDLLVWCFMPNHYHLFSCPLVDNGLANFHKKLGGGFAKFFNVKYERSGALFQGKYKKVRVTNDTQALQLICYIHSNPLELWKPNWKERGLTNLEIQNALKFLEKYRWSSHLDWWGIKNLPSLIDTNSMYRFFKNSKEYRDFFVNWLKYYEKNTQDLRGFTLE